MTYLDRFKAFDTSDTAAIADIALHTLGARSFDTAAPAGRLRGQGNRIDLGHVGLSYCSYSEPIKLAFPEANSLRQQLCVGGRATAMSGSGTTHIHAGESFISDGPSTVFDYSAAYRQLVLRLDRAFVTRKLQSLLGAASPRPIAFRNTPNGPRAQLHFQLVTDVADRLNATQALLPPLILDELQQLLAVSLLACNRHNYSHLLEAEPKDATPRVVRMVEEFIESNWRSPIAIDALTALTGTSARTIFSEFKKARGYTPMMFVKQVRLKQARAMLLVPDESTTVTGVALVCGFLNQGHFARDYHQAFGELPSATLTRGRHA